MRKPALFGLICACALAVGCGSAAPAHQASAASQSSLAKTYKLSVGNTLASTEAPARAEQRWADQVLRDTKGHVVIQQYNNEQTGSEDTQLAAVQKGLQFGYIGGDEPYESYTAYFDVLNLPFLWASVSSAKVALEGPVGATLTKQLEHAVHSFTVLGYEDEGPREMLSKMPITVPADLRGVPVRVAPTDSVTAGFYKDLGADPEVIGVSDVATSYLSGLIKAGDFPVDSIAGEGWIKTADYVSLTNQVLATGLLLVNTNVLDSLPAQYRAIVIKDGAEACAWEWGQEEDAQTRVLAEFKASGVHVLTVNTKTWQKATARYDANYISKLHERGITSLYRLIKKQY